MQSEGADDTVGAIIEGFRQNYNVTKSRLSVIQALLSQGIITLAQYMSLMYMKSVLSPCKNEHEGSVIAEVGSEHYASDAHDTVYIVDDQKKTTTQRKDQIEVLKGINISPGTTRGAKEARQCFEATTQMRFGKKNPHYRGLRQLFLTVS